MPFYLNWIYKKGHRFWAILQMKSCLSIKNGEHIEKLEMYYFFHISKPPQDSVLSFHYCLPKGVTNFECLLLNLHTLNYHNKHLYLPCHLEIKTKIWRKLKQKIDTESWTASKNFRIVILSLQGHIHSNDLVVMLELA